MWSKLLLSVFISLIGVNIQAQKELRRVFQPPNVVNEIPYGANPEVGQYVQTDDAKIYYEVYGSDPDRVKKLIAIGAGEQIPGLRKVVFVPTEAAFKMDRD